MKRYIIAALLAIMTTGAVQAAESKDSVATEGNKPRTEIDFTLEMSLSPRFHGTTPITTSTGIDLRPKAWHTVFSFGYQFLLETCYNGGDNFYRDAHGLYGAVGFDVFKKTIFRFKYAHSVGSNSFKYNMYDLGLRADYDHYNFGVGYRIIKSPTKGVKDYSGVYFAVALKL